MNVSGTAPPAVAATLAQGAQGVQGAPAGAHNEAQVRQFDGLMQSSPGQAAQRICREWRRR